MVTRRDRPTDDELRDERIEGLKRIRDANTDLVERALDQGVTFQPDDVGALRIAIGTRPATFYTQRIRGVRINLDCANHQIVEFVIDGVV